MGLLSSISGAVKKVASTVTSTAKNVTNYVATSVKNIPKAAVQVLDLNKAAFTNPVTLVTKGPSAAIKESNKLTPVQATTRTLTTTAIAAAALLVPTTAAGRAAATTVVKTAIPKSTVGKIAAVAAVPAVAGAVISRPVETAKVVQETPSNLFNFGGNVAELVAEPSIQKAKDVFKENPVIATTAAAGVVAGAGLATAGIISSVLNTQAVKESTKATEEATKLLTTQATAAPIAAPVAAAPTSAPTAPQTPLTPETKPLIATAGGTTTSTRRKKRSSKAVIPSVRQNLSVIVQNRATSTGIRQSKKFINREVLAY